MEDLLGGKELGGIQERGIAGEGLAMPERGRGRRCQVIRSKDARSDKQPRGAVVTRAERPVQVHRVEKLGLSEQ